MLLALDVHKQIFKKDYLASIKVLRGKIDPSLPKMEILMIIFIVNKFTLLLEFMTTPNDYILLCLMNFENEFCFIICM